ncbi:MAG TPA: hypothetical protein VIY48_03450 [Candidatus Paceibacterota bacterium]
MAALYISEYAAVGTPGPGPAMHQAPLEPAQFEQIVGIAASSTQSNAFGPETKIIRVAVVAAIPLLVEPVIYKRKVQQPDIYPNLAVKQDLEYSSVYLSDNIPRRLRPQPEIYPNLAVNQAVPQIAIRPLIEPSFKRKTVQFDISPNIAVRVTVTPYNPPPALQENPVKRKKVDFDLYPNLAVTKQTIQPGIPSYSAVPTIRKIRSLQPDIYPNLAVNYVLPVQPVPPPVEPTLKAHKFLQPDLAPNIAAKSAAEIPRVSAMVQPTYYIRHAPQIDIYPNIAIKYVPPVPGTFTVQINLGLSLSRMGGRVWS